MRAATSGNIEARTVAARAYRIHALALAAGRDDEESEEAEAGARIEAEDAHEARRVRAETLAVVKALAGVRE